MDTIRAFFSKSGQFFRFSKKGRGDLPPPLFSLVTRFLPLPLVTRLLPPDTCAYKWLRNINFSENLLTY